MTRHHRSTLRAAFQSHTLTVWRSTVERIAVPTPSEDQRRSALIIAPHPDDETFGCGATIARRRSVDTDVTIAIVADGRHAQARSSKVSPSQLAKLRRAEAVQACGELGVPPERVIQFGIEDTKVEFSYDQVVDRIRSLIRTANPDDIFTTSARDWHIDHQSVSRATRTAAAAESRDEILEYPIWSWIDGPWMPRPGTNRRGRAMHLITDPMETIWSLQVVGAEIGPWAVAKRRAINCYTSQVTNMTGESGWYVMAPETLDLFLRDKELAYKIDRLTGISL